MALNYFSFAGYNHPAGEVVPLSFTSTANRSDRGLVRSLTRELSIEVNIVATGDGTINQRIGEIMTTYHDRIADAIFYLSTGAASHFRLYGGNSLYGIQVDGPHWSVNPQQADFVTGISCSIGLKAEYSPAIIGWPAPGGGAAEAGSTDAIEVIGTGGPAFAITPLDNGPPQISRIHQATPVLVVQSGEAFSELAANDPDAYPPFAPYLFPENILNPLSDVRQRRDKQRTRTAGQKVLRSAWSYSFTFTSYPFVPSP